MQLPAVCNIVFFNFPCLILSMDYFSLSGFAIKWKTHLSFSFLLAWKMQMKCTNSSVSLLFRFSPPVHFCLYLHLTSVWLACKKKCECVLTSAWPALVKPFWFLAQQVQMKRMNTSVSLLFRLLIRPQFHFNCTFIELVLDRMQRHARCSDLCLTWWSCQTLNVGLFLGRCLSYLFQSRHCIHTCALKAQL